MKSFYFSLLLLTPMLGLAQTLKAEIEGAFTTATDAKISREYVNFEIMTDGYSKPIRTKHNLNLNPEAFARSFESVPTQGPKLGLSVASYIKKSQAIKNVLLTELKEAILKTKFLKDNDKAVTQLLETVQVKPNLYLFENRSGPTYYYKYTVDTSIELNGKKYCTFNSVSNPLLPELYSPKMRESIDSAITPECEASMKEAVLGMVESKESVLAMRNALESDRKELRTALNDDGRESVKNLSSSNRITSTKSIGAKQQ